MRCDCVVAPASGGWLETRGPYCEERDRAEWRAFVDELEAHADLVVEFLDGAAELEE